MSVLVTIFDVLDVDCIDVCDRWGRQLGQIDLARVLGAPLTVANPVISGIYDALGNRMPSMDAVARAGYVDVIDRWARQLGQIDLARVLGAALSPANPVISGIYDAAGNRMPTMDAVARAGYVDVIDRWARQLGQIDLARVLGAALTVVNPVIVGVYDAAGNRMPTMDALARAGYQYAYQATRTNLLVQPERDDLLQYSENVAAVGAGDTQLVAGVANQHIKVYACGYETDAAVVVGFRFGAGSTWCRRSTAGPFAQTFVHPMVGAHATDLNFRAEGAVNAYTWVQYIVEA